MATMGDSPSLFIGQPWSIWEEKAMSGKNEGSSTEEKQVEGKHETGSMKLRKEDMALFGLCPAQDEFYLVVCESCGQVIKPQALKHHIEQRHGSVQHASVSPVTTKSPVTLSRSGTPKSSRTPSPKPGSLAKPHTPPSFPSSKLNHDTRTASAEAIQSGKIQKNHSVPVVKVERMPKSIISKTISLPPQSSPSPPQLVAPSTATTVQSETAPVSSTLPRDKTPPPPTPPPLPPAAPPIPVVVQKQLDINGNARMTENEKDNSLERTNSGSGSKKPPKERKMLPCKDREFDPNKHCGVWIRETGRQCTRSLTCKTHALSLRRAVAGRRKPFDELLKDHRAAKEALLKAKAAEQAGHGGATNQNATVTSHDTISNSSFSPQKSPIAAILPPKINKPLNKVPNSVLPRPVLLPSVPKEEPSLPPPPPELVSRLSSDEGEYDGEESQDRMECSYIPYHPRPAAINTFGARLNGGMYVFDRRQNYLRSVVRQMVEKHLHPPPHKKLCVESKLPKNSHSFTDNHDPYEFTYVDNNHSLTAAAANVNLSWSNGKPVSRSAAVKAKSNVNRTIKPKDIPLSKSPPVHSSLAARPSANGSTPSNNNSTLKRKRSSGSTGSTSSTAASPNSSLTNLPGICTTTSGGVGSGGAGSANSSGNHPISIAIQHGISFNLSSTLSNINATFTTQQPSLKNSQLGKNNLLKDLSIVVPNLDASNVVNGHLLNLPSGTHLTDITQVQLQGLQTQVAPLGNTITASSANPVKSSAKVRSRSISGKQALGNKLLESTTSGNLNPVIAALPNSTILLDGSSGQSLGGALFTGNIGNTAMSPPPQPSPSTTPSPLFRSGSASPQVSVPSPLPNGIVSSPSGGMGLKGFHINHMTVSPASRNSSPSPSPTSAEFSPAATGGHFQKLTGKGQSSSTARSSYQKTLGNLQKQQQLASQQSSSAAAPATPQQLATTFNLSMSPASRLITTNNFHQVYANQVFSAGQLQQLQIQPKGVATGAAAKHAAAAGKMQTMQPVSLTIPIVAQSAIPNMTLAPQHTMQAQFITNDEQRKLLDQVSSNTSTNLLS